MKKTNTLIITTILLIVTLCTVIFSGCTKTKYAEADLNFDGLGSAPTQEAKDKAMAVNKDMVALSDNETENQDVLDSIEYLLRLANLNLIDCDFFAAAAGGSGVAQMIITGDPIAGSMQTRDVRIFDHDTYYYDSYGRVIEGYKIKKNGSRGKNVSPAILSMLSTALNFNKRTYSPNNKDFYFTKDGKGDENSIVKFPDQNAIIYKKPKVEKMTFDEYVKKNWYRDNYKGFTTDDYDTDKPITSGFIKYNSEKGIYYLEANINCDDETLKFSNEDMLESSAINKFRYTTKRVKIEIWECGLIKSYINQNTWSATILSSIKGSSENIYEQWFTYDKSKLDKMNISQDLKNALVKK